MPHKTVHPIRTIVATTLAQKNLGMQIRGDVFVREQGVPPHLERDGNDDTATQYLAQSGKLTVGTARSRILGQSEEKIERVAITKKYRGLGYGFTFMQQILDSISSRGIEIVTIHAQIDVVPFYQRLNFKSVGPEFIEAGIVHQEMTVRPIRLSDSLAPD